MNPKFLVIRIRNLRVWVFSFSLFTRFSFPFSFSLSTIVFLFCSFFFVLIYFILRANDNFCHDSPIHFRGQKETLELFWPNFMEMINTLRGIVYALQILFWSYSMLIGNGIVFILITYVRHGLSVLQNK